ncbi:MAG: aldo/keto reductase [Kiritimatiellia bacterium]|nr:aldo/keto reductase [Kiritimatiellia bacterium]MDP6847528.1 aldo/keto reductase [Kiritimatiellia bacterium]
MKYRRFGRTELQMPVITCGGMRFQQSWEDIDPKDLDAKGQVNLEETVRYAFANGINHFETARGYGSSEYQLGFVLPTLPRDEIIVQTKVTPKDSEKEFLEAFEKSLKHLQLDHVDLLGVHGINNLDLLDKTLNKGTLAACRKLQDQGLAKFIGFSTHAGPATVTKTVQTGEFDYVNLHWYYIDQCNWPAILEAKDRDMGVFIISPCDKGGKLYDPPQKLVDLCNPLTPMGFNDLFCLSRDEVNTISIGATRPTDFDAHLEILPLFDSDPLGHITPILDRLQSEFSSVLGEEWMGCWDQGWPSADETPDEVPIYHLLRMYNLAKALDMVVFGKMRYNMVGTAEHWFPGVLLDKTDRKKLVARVSEHPMAERVLEALQEGHDLLKGEEKKRLSESGS